MALKLFRRHRKECEGGHAEDARSGEFEEGRRGWKRCACIIHVSGTLGGTFSRKQTGKWQWDDAKAIAAELERAGRWDGVVTPPQPAVVQTNPDRVTILDATKSFLAKCEGRNIAKDTLRKYKTFVKQLRAYTDSRGYMNIDQLTTSDMDRFYASWKDGIRAKAKKLDRLKSFIKFCRKRKWITEDLTEDLAAPQGSSIAANKTPFTDKELERIYAACDRLGPPNMKRGPGFRPWGGEDAKDFLLLLIYTGLRISDACTFDTAKRLNGNNVFLRMHKTQKELYTWIPDWLVERLRAREKVKGSHIFRSGQSLHLRTVTEEWRRKLNKVFEQAGPFEERPTPHRCRHTFVRILLEKGVPVADIAELIGDTENILRKHYSRWISSRQDRLSRILREAFDEKPQPAAKIVAIR
jgi:integrase